MTDKRTIEIVYDKQCPVCDYYCRKFDAASREDEVLRTDAREPSDALDDITALGLDVDEGMVVKVDDRLHYGSDAIHELALLSSGKGLVNGIGRLVFRSKRAAALLYPLLKACRNLLLKLLGRTRINNLEQPGRDRF